jgi:hypothetical protein
MGCINEEILVNDKSSNENDNLKTINRKNINNKINCDNNNNLSKTSNLFEHNKIIENKNNINIKKDGKSKNNSKYLLSDNGKNEGNENIIPKQNSESTTDLIYSKISNSKYNPKKIEKNSINNIISYNSNNPSSINNNIENNNNNKSYEKSKLNVEPKVNASKYANLIDNSNSYDSNSKFNKFIEENINKKSIQINESYAEINSSYVIDTQTNFRKTETEKINKKDIEIKEYINIKNENYSQDFKTILLIGEKNNGKSSFINCFLNYCKNVKYKDNFRYKLIKKNKPTEKIEEYFINENDKKFLFIDTPGFYGEKKYEKNDNKNLKDIINYISNKNIHMFCFVVNSNIERYSEKLKKIINICFSFLKDEYLKNIIIIYSNYINKYSLTSEKILLNINKDIFEKINKNYVISNNDIFFEELYSKTNEKLYEEIKINLENFYCLLCEVKPINFKDNDYLKNEESLDKNLKKFQLNLDDYINSIIKNFDSFFNLEQLKLNLNKNEFIYKDNKENKKKLQNILSNIENIEINIDDLNKNSLIKKKTDIYIKNKLDTDEKKDIFINIYNKFKLNKKNVRIELNDYIIFNQSFQKSYFYLYLQKLFRENNIEEIITKFPYPNFDQKEFEEIKKKENYLNIIKEKYNVEKDLYFKTKIEYTIYKLIFNYLNK